MRVSWNNELSAKYMRESYSNDISAKDTLQSFDLAYFIINISIMLRERKHLKKTYI